MKNLNETCKTNMTPWTIAVPQLISTSSDVEVVQAVIEGAPTCRGVRPQHNNLLDELPVENRYDPLTDHVPKEAAEEEPTDYLDRRLFPRWKNQLKIRSVGAYVRASRPAPGHRRPIWSTNTWSSYVSCPDQADWRVGPNGALFLNEEWCSVWSNMRVGDVDLNDIAVTVAEDIRGECLFEGTLPWCSPFVAMRSWREPCARDLSSWDSALGTVVASELLDVLPRFSRNAAARLEKTVRRGERRSRRKELMMNRFVGDAQGLFDFAFSGNVEHTLRVPVVAELLEFLKQARADVDWKRFIVEAAFFLGHLTSGGLTTSNLVTAIAHFMYSVGFPADLFSWNTILRFLPNGQSADGALGVLGVAIAGIISAGGVWAFGKLPKDKDIDMFINRFSRIGQCMTSMEKLMGMADTISDWVMEFIRVYLLGYSSSDLKEWEKVDEFCDQVRDLNTPDFNMRAANDTDGTLKSTITTLLQRADEISRMLDMLKAPQVATQRFRASHMFLVKARDIVAGADTGVLRSRVAPLVIHFWGTTGVGKSSMLDYLNSDLLVELGSTNPDDLVNKVYYRHPTSDFYDGFKNGTQILVCDDFGSAKDSEARPSSEPGEQIRMTNTTPFKPPMAHLTDKANAIFEAPVVIWTSNRPSFAFASLTNPEAVHNRVHLRFCQRVHPDYAIKKNVNGQLLTTLDNEKVAEAALTDPDVYRKCMQFQRESIEGLANINGSYAPMGELLSFEEMRTICVQHLRRKQTHGHATKTARAKYFEESVLRGRANAGEDVATDGERALVMQYFHRPGYIGRMCGAPAHLNVFKTLDRNIGIEATHCVKKTKENGKHVAGLDMMMNEIFAAHCIMVQPEAEHAVTLALLLGYKDYVLGKPEAFEHLRTAGPFIVCNAHHDFDAEWSFMDHCVTSAAEAASIGLVKGMISYLQFAEKNPVLASIASLLTAVGTYYLIKKCISFMISQLCSTVKFSTTVVTAGVAAAVGYVFPASPSGETEGTYATAVKAPVVTNVEAYPASTVKAAVVARTEAYPNATVRGAIIARTEGMAESLTDQNADEVRTKVFRNAYHISTRQREGDAWLSRGTLTFLSGRVAVTNRHIYNSLLSQVRLRSAHGPRETIFLREDLNVAFVADDHILYGQRDVVMIEFPRHCAMHGSLLDYFMTAEDFSRHDELSRVCLVSYNHDDPPAMIYQSTDRCVAYHRETFGLVTPGASGSEITRVREFYTYGLETKAGDCGGLLVSFDTRFNRKLVGIHMAGVTAGPYTAAGAAICRGFLDELRSALKCRWTHSWVNGDVPVPQAVVAAAAEGLIVCENPVEGFDFVGRANSRVYSAPASAIRPSPVADVLGPVNKKPAALRPFHIDGTRYDPMAIALKKAKTPNTFIEPGFLAMATEQVRQLICTNVQETDRRSLTFREAIEGIQGDPHYPPINRSTSPGFGWPKIGKGKTHWLGDGQDYKVDDPAVLAAYEAAMSRVREGKRIGAYWTDTLKDELRPIAKVDQGKTRLFAAGEMVLTILLRQHFDGLAAHMARNCVTVESCVGVNPYGFDWTRIANRLRSHGPAVTAGDFTNYDGTLPGDLLWAVLDIVEAFFRPDGAENARIREVLWLEIVNSVHVNGDSVYVWSHSQPSGCPFTSILNSIAHSIIVRVAFLIAQRDAGFAPDLSVFQKKVAHVNYGDDDVTNISMEIIDWFNQQTMTTAYAQFGMTYTDEFKSGALEKFKTLEETQFLKRMFVFDSVQQRYRAPLELATILEMACWNKTKGDRYALTGETLCDALAELGHHERSIWDAHFPKFELARQRLASHVSVYLPSFDEFQRREAFKYLGEAQTCDPSGYERHYAGGDCRCTMCPACKVHGGCNWHCILCRHGVGKLRFEDAKCLREELKEQNDVIGAASQSLTERRQQILLSWAVRCPGEIRTLDDDSDGELFSSIGRRVPSQKSKLPTQRATAMSGPSQSLRTRPSNNESTVAVSEGGNPDFAGGDTAEITQQTVTFFQDGVVGHSDREPSKDVPRVLQVSGEDKLVSDIVGFLSRPILLRNFEWKTEDGFMANLANINLPIAWLNERMVKEKLAGFRYLRCTLVVELQVNAQPFNAGGIILSFNPVAQQLQVEPSSYGHLGGIMGYPHVIYRCGSNTAVQLRVPFFPLLSHFDLSRDGGTMGTVNATIMSPLTGSANCDGTIWCWAEDIDVSMPTGYNQLSGAAQMGGVTERKRPGNVETAAKALASVSGSLAKAPGIGAFAAVGETVLNTAGNIAAIFGWSKPLDPEYPTQVHMSEARYMANANGDFKGKVLALDAKNTVNLPREVFNTDEDEMAFSTILKKPIFTDRFEMTGTQGQQALLWKWPVEPGTCRKTLVARESTGNAIQRQENYVSYLSSLAMYWRGGLVYDFTVFKTSFHSGRIRVMFVPGANQTDTLATVDVSKCYSQIYDLRECSDIRFEVPYSYNQPWKRTEWEVPPATAPTAIDLTWVGPQDVQGMIYVQVINALRNPTTAASTIAFYVMVSAAPDFQFALPWANPQIHVLSAASEIGAMSLTGPAQSLYPSDEPVGLEANALSVGEAFTGFRQWLKRAHELPSYSHIDRPFVINHESTVGRDVDIARQNDPFLRAETLYRFYAGSMRMTCVSNSGAPVRYTARTTSGAFVGPSIVLSKSGVAVAENTILEPIVDFEVPYYQLVPAIMTGVGLPNTYLAGGSAFTSLPYNEGTLFLVEPTTVAESLAYYRSIGEDFSYGYLLGPPITLAVQHGT